MPLAGGVKPFYELMVGKLHEPFRTAGLRAGRIACYGGAGRKAFGKAMDEHG